MSETRREPTYNEQLLLVSQVGSHCPLCGSPLIYEKKKNKYKAYECAHIYPLNPTTEEINELDGAPRLSVDTNHLDNFIALCNSCHKQFDRPRDRAEYDRLYQIKRAAIEKEAAQDIQRDYALENRVSSVLEALCSIEAEDGIKLVYTPVETEKKFNESMPYLKQREINDYISSFFSFVKSHLEELDRLHLNQGSIILQQVRVYYTALKVITKDQQSIFARMVDWIAVKTGTAVGVETKIIAAYFVQNCEIFDDNTQ